MSLYGLTLTNTLFQLNHCNFPIKMSVIDFSVGFFGILVDLVIAASPAWYCSQKSQSDFPGTCHVRHIGISSPCMSSSSWAVKGFWAEDDSSTAVVEIDWEWECVEVEAADAEPEPEATGIESAWSESVQWWTAAWEMADREIKGPKKDYKDFNPDKIIQIKGKLTQRISKLNLPSLVGWIIMSSLSSFAVKKLPLLSHIHHK